MLNNSEENHSIFEGQFWKKYSLFASADILSCLFWLGICFPFLVLLTERSKGDRVQIRLSETLTIIGLLGLSLSFHLQVGRFMGWASGSALSIVSGVFVGLIVALAARRSSWILVTMSLMFFTSIVSRLFAFAFW